MATYPAPKCNLNRSLVTLQNLVKAPELNGRRGQCRGPDPKQKDRVMVLLANKAGTGPEGKLRSVKVSNVDVLGVIFDLIKHIVQVTFLRGQPKKLLNPKTPVMYAALRGGGGTHQIYPGRGFS